MAGPALVTLGVTVLRLVGELRGWSPLFFSHAPGAASVVGIAWLVPVFGVYFAASLAGIAPPPRAGRVLGFAALAVLPVPLLAFLAFPVGYYTHELAIALASLAAAGIAYRGWPALGRVLLLYGLTARIPVVLIALATTLGEWGTHYGAPPPVELPPSLIARWVLGALVPQLTFWVAFTVVVGALAGGAALAVTAPRKGS